MGHPAVQGSVMEGGFEFVVSHPWPKAGQGWGTRRSL